jgi:hypothetical protein
MQRGKLRLTCSQQRESCLCVFIAQAHDTVNATQPRHHGPSQGRNEIKFILSRKAKRFSTAQASIQAALEIAREHARIIEASNHQVDNDRPQIDSQPVQDGTQSAVTQ